MVTGVLYRLWALRRVIVIGCVIPLLVFFACLWIEGTYWDRIVGDAFWPIMGVFAVFAVIQVLTHAAFPTAAVMALKMVVAGVLILGSLPWMVRSGGPDSVWTLVITLVLTFGIVVILSHLVSMIRIAGPLRYLQSIHVARPAHTVFEKMRIEEAFGDNDAVKSIQRVGDLVVVIYHGEHEMRLRETADAEAMTLHVRADLPEDGKPGAGMSSETGYAVEAAGAGSVLAFREVVRDVPFGIVVGMWLTDAHQDSLVAHRDRIEGRRPVSITYLRQVATGKLAG